MKKKLTIGFIILLLGTQITSIFSFLMVNKFNIKFSEIFETEPLIIYLSILSCIIYMFIPVLICAIRRKKLHVKNGLIIYGFNSIIIGSAFIIYAVKWILIDHQCGSFNPHDEGITIIALAIGYAIVYFLTNICFLTKNKAE